MAASIIARYPDMSPGEIRIADVLLELGPDLIYRSVTDVAALADCAISSVVRCCQRLGFKGFQDLKIAFSRDVAHPVQALTLDSATDGSPAALLAHTCDSASEAIAHGAAAVDLAAFTAAADILAGADRILLVGVGTSAPLVQDAAYRLTTIGLHADAPADVHVQHVRAGLLTPADVCLVVSHTGSTRETVSVVAAARQSGAKVVAVSSFSHSPLSEHVDVLLVAGSRETAFRVEAMASRIAHLVLLDALHVVIAQRRAERADGALQRTADVLAEHRF